jgi:hypothetical protein
MNAHRLHKNLHTGGWNFRSCPPLYGTQGCKTHPPVFVLRSLSALQVPIDVLRRFSSLPLFFVSGRFATIFFPAPADGGRP